MQYLILGNGYICNMLKQRLGDRARIYPGTILDAITDDKLGDFDVLINTAAKTNIDWCEQNKQEALQVNAWGALELAELCQELGKRYVFISSACIFESKDIDDIKYEDSKPNPGCFYAETKVLAEHLIREKYPQSLIIRPRLPLSFVPHPRNTINKILSYDKLQTNQE